VTFEEALHAYYSVSDVRQIEVSGWAIRTISTVQTTQSGNIRVVGAIRFAGETDSYT